jgi:hypothetical protein
MAVQNLEFKIVQALEDGFNKHLKRSFVYSPFRLFFNLFKKANPKSVEQARQILREDILKIISSIEGFNQAIFLVKQTQLTPKGKEMLKKCYNIGIRILKYELTVTLAFKALRDHNLLQDIYENILKEVQEVVAAMIAPKDLVSEQKIENK